MRITAMLFFCVLAAGCQRSIDVTVNAAAQPDVDWSQYHRFAVSTATNVADRQQYLQTQIMHAITDVLIAQQAQPDRDRPADLAFSADPVELQELAHVARNTLLQRPNMLLDPADPQLLLTIDDCTGSYAFAVQIKSVDVPLEAQPRPMVITPSGSIESQPQPSGSGVITDSRTSLLPVRAVSLTIYDARKPDRPLWQASAVSLHSGQSLRTLAPYLIRAMLAEFPAPTGQPAQRQIPLQ